jgi:hypothetical protein
MRADASKCIDPREVVWSGLSSSDEIGSVFTHGDRVFRAISPGHAQPVRELLGCGLIQELTRRGLFPETEVANVTLEGYPLLLEHRRLPVTSYPYEWSLAMLRDAGRAVLEVNRLAAEFGYQLKDCHAYNVLFDGLQPVFVDFGSFVRRTGDNWLAYEEFVRSYLYPSAVWAQGNHYLAQKICADLSPMPHSSFLLYRYPAARSLARFVPLFDKLAYLYFRARLVSAYPEPVLRQRVPPRLGPLLEGALALERSGLMPLQRVNLAKLRERLDQVATRTDRSLWGSYHAELLDDQNRVRSTPRFDRVVELVRQLGSRTVLELGGNRGVLSRLLLQTSDVQRVICSDRDELAIDELYRGCPDRLARLHPVVLDMMAPQAVPGLPSSDERFRADTVLALALTHHLFLRPPFYSFQRVLDAIASYSKRYVLVEFMPLGLLDKGRAPALPDGYTLERFREAFRTRFALLREEALEENRVLFLGERYQ